ncbi:MAG: acyl-CoA/acyl-ACP dehydrogenase [Acidimicrobiia bacterium]|nr:acyl-CoA/acyl-ACP dehydrogenase [Acidimicrobiia bacterium]
MDFEFTDEQLELQRTVRDLLEQECPPELVRKVIEGGSADDFWSTLVSLDWPGLALPEEYGGTGYSWVELAIVLEELGRAVAPGPFLATVTQFAPAIAAAGSADQQRHWLSQVAAGSVSGAFAVDEGAGTWQLEDVAATGRIDGDQVVLTGTKRFVLDGATADEVAVAVLVDGAVRVVVVPRTSLHVDGHDPIDATSVHAELGLDGVRIPVDRLLGDGPAVGLGAAIEEASVAIALATVGASSRIFELTLDYAKQRHQFGVPIGSFQAVKHKLADMYRDVERARALAFYAALCLAEGDDRSSAAASMAKAAAGECQQRCAQDGLQLFGGIGYTWEHDLHLYLRRAKVGELTFGSSSHHRQRVARLALS